MFSRLFKSPQIIKTKENRDIKREEIIAKISLLDVQIKNLFTTAHDLLTANCFEGKYLIARNHWEEKLKSYHEVIGTLFNSKLTSLWHKRSQRRVAYKTAIKHNQPLDEFVDRCQMELDELRLHVESQEKFFAMPEKDRDLFGELAYQAGHIINKLKPYLSPAEFSIYHKEIYFYLLKQDKQDFQNYLSDLQKIDMYRNTKINESSDIESEEKDFCAPVFKRS